MDRVVNYLTILLDTKQGIFLKDLVALEQGFSHHKRRIRSDGSLCYTRGLQIVSNHSYVPRGME